MLAQQMQFMLPGAQLQPIVSSPMLMLQTINECRLFEESSFIYQDTDTLCRVTVQ